MNESQLNKKEEKKNSSPIRKVLSIVSWVLTGLLTALAVLVLILGLVSMKEGKLFRIFNYSYSVVVTQSMEPVINVNDIIVIKYVDYDTIEKDDIIVFYNPKEDKNITHRVIEITEEGFTTKGDNNPVSDTFVVTEEYFIGKVVKYGSFSGIGGLIVNGRGVFFIVIIAIFAYFIISEIVNILKMVQEKRRKEILEEQKQQNDKDLEELKKYREELKEQMRKEMLNELNKKEEDK